MGSYSDKISSNVAINAVDLPYRFMGVSDSLNRIRLYGNMAMGGSLDWCIIGNFDDYTDYENFEGVREIFAFHEKYEQHYGHFNSKTKIMLISSEEWHACDAEYRGIFRMLKEEHILFTIVENEALAAKIHEFDDYDFILIPGAEKIDGIVAEALKNTSASIIASKYAFAENPALLADLFGVQLGKRITDVRGTYISPEPRADFPDFHKKKWIYLDGPYYPIQLNDAKGLLPKITKARYGPPERCFGHQNTSEKLAACKNGNVYLPWEIGSLYYLHGYSEFKRLYLNLMRMLKPIPRAFLTDAPEMVEMFFAQIDEQTYMFQLINLTGFNGSTFFDALPLQCNVRFTDITPSSIEELTPHGLQSVPYNNGMHISVLANELYKAFLIKI